MAVRVGTVVKGPMLLPDGGDAGKPEDATPAQHVPAVLPWVTARKSELATDRLPGVARLSQAPAE